MRDSTRMKNKQKMARYNLQWNKRTDKHTRSGAVPKRILTLIRIAHLTATCSQVLSSINITNGIICVKNIIRLDKIAENLTTSNMRWHIDFCGPSFLFVVDLLTLPLAVDEESRIFIFFLRGLTELADCETLSSTFDGGRDTKTFIVASPSSWFASEDAVAVWGGGGGGGGAAGGGTAAPR